jgi:hypothetical protein
MKKRLQFMFTAFAAVALSTSANAQCPAGQGQLDIDVTTDTYGYEFYFEITPAGDPCGTNTIYSGGSTVVGCAGGGAQAQNTTDPSVYADNSVITENVGCFDLTDCFTLTMVDDWGDGGTQIDVKVDGAVLYTFVMGGADATNVYNFCMQQLNYDLSVDGGSKGNYYAMIPNEHSAATTLSFSADITNAGQMDLTGATVSAVVNDGTTDVHTATSTPVTLTASATNNVALTPDYTLPTTMGTYTVTYTGSVTEADEDMNNNELTSTFEVTDSVLSRVITSTGALGIGAGVADNGKLGQTFNIPVNDAITSISGYHRAPTLGDSVKYAIWDLVGGQPGSEIVATDAYVFTAADTLNGVMVTLALPAVLNITAGTDYVVMAYEYNNNLSLGTNAIDYEMGTNWVSWAGNAGGAWANGEDFSFAVNYALYVNFGNVISVKENTLSNISVYPNPARDVVNVQLTEDVNNATVVVYAMDGSVVSTKVVSGSLFTVDVQDFSNGIYMVEVRDNNKTGVIKIIKE